MPGPLVVVACDSLATYPMGGGHWSWALQYGLGLRDLGVDVRWLELMPRLKDQGRQQEWIDLYFRRMAEHGFEGRCALVVDAGEGPPLEVGAIFGPPADDVRRLPARADLLLNLAGAASASLLSQFRRTALLDVDPGITQASALSWPEYRENIVAHDILFTVGMNVGQMDCGVPTLGLDWKPVPPIVHLPTWPVAAPPPHPQPFTALTHWNWDSVSLDSRVLDASKRVGFLRYAAMPLITGERFHLATRIHPGDTTGDREVLLNHGWSIEDAQETITSPAAYQRFIACSGAEFACTKPIYRELRTGWVSDRSPCYLASGRPVVMEDTGISGWLPAGEGLLLFTNFDDAVEAVQRVRHDFQRHAAAARALAENVFDSRLVLAQMMRECGL